MDEDNSIDKTIVSGDMQNLYSFSDYNGSSQNDDTSISRAVIKAKNDRVI